MDSPMYFAAKRKEYRTRDDWRVEPFATRDDAKEWIAQQVEPKEYEILTRIVN